MNTITKKVKAKLIIDIELEVTEEQSVIIQLGKANKVSCTPTGQIQMAAADHAPLLWIFEFHQKPEFMEMLKGGIHQYLSFMREQDPLSKEERFKKSPLL